MEEFLTTQFWFAVGSIVLIDILLGGDNAVVIALACRQLDEHQREKGVILGTMCAIVLRLILIFFALSLLRMPFLKLIGCVLLIYIGVKLLLPHNEHLDSSKIKGSTRLWGAVKTVAIADLVMSLDNVVAIAGAAQSAHQDHHMMLVILGLVVSIPVIVWGSQLVMNLMGRYPIIITLGGMLLGWIAGTMAMGDLFVTQNVLPQTWVHLSVKSNMLEPVATLHYLSGILGAVCVLLISYVFKKKNGSPRT